MPKPINTENWQNIRHNFRRGAESGSGLKACFLENSKRHRWLKYTAQSPNAVQPHPKKWIAETAGSAAWKYCPAEKNCLVTCLWWERSVFMLLKRLNYLFNRAVLSILTLTLYLRLIITPYMQKFIVTLIIACWAVTIFRESSIPIVKRIGTHFIVWNSI